MKSEIELIWLPGRISHFAPKTSFCRSDEKFFKPQWAHAEELQISQIAADGTLKLMGR